MCVCVRAIVFCCIRMSTLFSLAFCSREPLCVGGTPAHACMTQRSPWGKDVTCWHVGRVRGPWAPPSPLPTERPPTRTCVGRVTYYVVPSAMSQYFSLHIFTLTRTLRSVTTHHSPVTPLLTPAPPHATRNSLAHVSLALLGAKQDAVLQPKPEEPRGNVTAPRR
jgi:hypothetical protein